MQTILEAADARVVIDLERGGRLSSLEIAGLELLVPERDDPLAWGCYAMAPWAGRVRNGVFSYAGITHQLPTTMPPHAIHGTTCDRQWRDEGNGCASIDLGIDWPFSGRVQQSFRLADDVLELQLELTAVAEDFPGCIGWHPWFQRQLVRGEPVQLEFQPRLMYIRDVDGIPNGKFCAPGPGPWDDCFTGLKSMPVLTWPGALELEIESTASHWVVYDEPDHALCVEPQTGPPDAFNLAPEQVFPHRSLIMDTRFIWRIL